MKDLLIKPTREEREIAIIEAAGQLVEKNGFVNLKMSDLAHSASMSIGTLYSHFPSKEDLLLGIHLHNLVLKEKLFSEVLNMPKWNPLQRLVAMVLANWDLDRKRCELSEIDALAMFPSIWQKASAGVTGRLEEVSRRIGDMIKANVDQVVSENKLKLISNELPMNVTIRATFWGTGLGLHHVFRSFCLKKIEGTTTAMEESIAAEALSILVHGLGVKNPIQSDEVKDLLNTVQTLTRKSLA